MLELIPHGHVVRVLMWSRTSRAVGYSVSAYLTRGIVIDSGFPAVRREFADFVDRVRPAGIMITHAHEDHAGNVAVAAERALPVALAPGTLAALRSGRPIGLYRRVIWGDVRPLTEPVQSLEPDGLRLVATPGHSPDHHVVWDEERETLFAGDLFLGVKVRAAHGGEDPRLLARSLLAIAALEPRLMFDAHRGLVSDPAAALRAKADWIEHTIAAIERRIAAGWSDRRIARAVLGREDLSYYVSSGGLSRINFVRAVRRAPDR